MAARQQPPKSTSSPAPRPHPIHWVWPPPEMGKPCSMKGSGELLNYMAPNYWIASTTLSQVQFNSPEGVAPRGSPWPLLPLYFFNKMDRTVNNLAEGVASRGSPWPLRQFYFFNKMSQTVWVGLKLILSHASAPHSVFRGGGPPRETIAFRPILFPE